MPLMPQDALERTITFNDFVKLDKTMPGPGEYATAAQTFVGVKANEVGINKTKVDGKTVFKVDDVITVTVIFSNKSWVAQYVLDKWRDSDRAALRGHEHIHYMIAALSGRDYLDDLDALRLKTFDKSADGTAAVDAVKKKYTVGKIQEIHDKYDATTHHDAIGNPDKQKSWTDAVTGALSSGTNLRAALKAAALMA